MYSSLYRVCLFSSGVRVAGGQPQQNQSLRFKFSIIALNTSGHFIRAQKLFSGSRGGRGRRRRCEVAHEQEEKKRADEQDKDQS